ncbi:hypothetical protein F4778DRAFT_784431 [Xylariomycetidae sp. FL2044]|nr:hypothetical protein F4778DRAFT_784431 [Xylariomycetidae sp. FL2044]
MSTGTTTTECTASPSASTTPSFPDTSALLRYLYADLRRLRLLASPDIVLHRWDRPASGPLRGVDAAQAHEESLYAATGGTLVMEVTHVSANEHYGSVLGLLRSRRRRGQGGGGGGGGDGGAEETESVVPFCGVWRFAEDGKLVEHWEHAITDPI